MANIVLGILGPIFGVAPQAVSPLRNVGGWLRNLRPKHRNENDAHLAIVIKIENKCKSFRLYNPYMNIKNGDCSSTPDMEISSGDNGECSACNARFGCLGTYGFLCYDIENVKSTKGASKGMLKLVLLWSVRMRRQKKFTAIGIIRAGENHNQSFVDKDNVACVNAEFIYKVMAKERKKNWFCREQIPKTITYDSKAIDLPIIIQGKINDNSPFSWTVTLSEKGQSKN